VRQAAVPSKAADRQQAGTGNPRYDNMLVHHNMSVAQNLISGGSPATELNYTSTAYQNYRITGG
jgi:hypothetical protein